MKILGLLIIICILIYIGVICYRNIFIYFSYIVRKLGINDFYLYRGISFILVLVSVSNSV